MEGNVPLYRTAVQSGSGKSLVYNVAHHASSVSSWFTAVATSEAEASISYVTADATNTTLHYNTSSAKGIENLSLNWSEK